MITPDEAEELWLLIRAFHADDRLDNFEALNSWIHEHTDYRSRF